MATTYNFSETAKFLKHEISLNDLREEVYTSALNLSKVDDPDLRAKFITEAQAVAIEVLDFLRTIKEK